MRLASILCPRVSLLFKVINHRRIVGDVNLFPLYQMREVVILFQSFARLGQDGVELLSQPSILDMFDLAC